MNADPSPPEGQGQPADPLATRTIAPSERPESSPAARPLPSHVGRYAIMRLIGEGGMGAVYEAQQEQPRRRVALKVIRPGYATPDHLRRFQREAEALARLQHAGIAQIYEAGTADSGFGDQPYFAMEFIARAESLTRYAEARRLASRQRVELVAKICDAVHHAHQRGLIHRDLKPSNILVDDQGNPKILDFGVARVTDCDTQATRQTDVGQLVGTLAYMSPEQALADPLELDIRSDVYALGVILYELLAGKLPYTLSPRLHEAVMTIREQDPAALRSVSRMYRGDIETIVAKALEKDKTRRYASAADLAADIRRYLDDQPIVARPASVLYQLQKFARRHTALVAGIATVFLVLVVGMAATGWEAVRARTAQQLALVERDQADASRRQTALERDRANTERNRAVAAEAQAIAAETKAVDERNKAVIAQRKADTEAATSRAINDFLQTDLLGQASVLAQTRPDNKPDPDLKVRTALDRAAERIAGKFDGMPLVEASLRFTLGNTYRDLGLLAGAEKQLVRAAELRQTGLGPDHPDTLDVLFTLGLTYQDLGKYAEAEKPLLHVLEVNRRRWGPDHLKTIRSTNALAIVYYRQGKSKEALSLYEDAVSRASRTLGDDNEETLQDRNNLTGIYFALGKYQESRESLAKVADGLRRVKGEEHPTTLVVLGNLSAVELMLGNLDRAESLRKQVIDTQRRVLGDEHPNTLASLHELANIYSRQGKYSEAVAILNQLLETRRRVSGPDHPETLREMDQLGVNLRNQGKYAEAERFATGTLEARRRVLGAKHPDTLSALYNLALLDQYQGKYAEAERLLQQAVEESRQALGKEHPTTLSRMETLAAVDTTLGKYDDATKLYTEALEIRRRVSGQEHVDTAGTMVGLGGLLNLRNDFEHSEPILRQALAIRSKEAPRSWGRFLAESLLGASLAGQRKFSEAEALLRTGLQGLIDHRPEIPATGLHFLDSAGEALVRLYQDTGENQKALDWQQRLQGGSFVQQQR